MTIDAHQHFWIFEPVRDSWIDESMKVLKRDFLPYDLETLLKQSGVDGCVAVQADQSEKETTFLLAQAKQYSFIKKVVGWVDLSSEKIEERLNVWSGESKLAGFRHILQGEPPEKMRDPAFRKGIAALSKRGYTYDLLIYPQHLDEAFGLAKAFPNQPFVVDHLAKPKIKDRMMEPWKKKIETLAELPNVYCKLSGMATEAHHKLWEERDLTPYMDVVLEAFGPKRVMFGSDWPVCLLAADYPITVNVVRNYIGKMSSHEQQLIMGETACRFYNI